MKSQIKTYTYPNGEIQRIQVLRWEDWSGLDFLPMEPSGKSLEAFSAIYRNFLIPAAPWMFGHMILFRLPEDLDPGFSPETSHGLVADRLTAAAIALEAGVKIRGGKPSFRDDRIRVFWAELEKRDCIRIVSGMLPTTRVIPLNDLPGTMTETAPDARMKVNASFFIMDPFDCATAYDQVGTPFGLCVRNGTVSHPPLYHREALLVNRDGTVSIRPMDVSMLDIQIGGTLYTPGKNCTVYTRPRRTRTPVGTGTALVIIGNRVAAVSKGSVQVPASGFVLCPREDCAAAAGDAVAYLGLEDVVFGIQVGNSILRDGEKTTAFRSKFYNIRHLEPVPYPPSLYPMDFARARAARIALGADKDGKPMLLWAEGAAKFGYVPGKGSCGASLREMAELCADVGMHNAVNLDGGGSAQILVHNRRSLLISDRKASDHTEAERPVPLGLYIAAK